MWAEGQACHVIASQIDNDFRAFLFQRRLSLSLAFFAPGSAMKFAIVNPVIIFVLRSQIVFTRKNTSVRETLPGKLFLLLFANNRPANDCYCMLISKGKSRVVI